MFEGTFALSKIKTSTWVDFGHVLGNAIQGTDRISFLSDQSMFARQRSLFL